MVARSGLPVGYEVFPGATYEGRTFLPMIEAMRHRHTGMEAVCVADAAMFTRDNLKELEAAGYGHIVGARLRNRPKALKGRILDAGRYWRLRGGEASAKVEVFRHQGRRIVVSHSPKRAATDAADHQRAVRRLPERMNKDGGPKSLVPRGAARFVRMKGKGHWKIDPDPPAPRMPVRQTGAQLNLSGARVAALGIHVVGFREGTDESCFNADRHIPRQCDLPCLARRYTVDQHFSQLQYPKHQEDFLSSHVHYAILP